MAEEFIGAYLEVLFAPCLDQIGLKGRVVDETKNTFLIDTEKGRRRIPKCGRLFLIAFPSGESLRCWGEEIAFRPEERIKKILR